MLRVDDEILEWRRSGNQHVTIDDCLVLERKGVERSAEFSGREQKRRGESVPVPGLGQRPERLEVGCVYTVSKGDRRGGTGSDERDEALVEHAATVTGHPVEGALGRRRENE